MERLLASGGRGNDEMNVEDKSGETIKSSQVK
jgi:hypothetical protein